MCGAVFTANFSKCSMSDVGSSTVEHEQPSIMRNNHLKYACSSFLVNYVISNFIEIAIWNENMKHYRQNITDNIQLNKHNAKPQCKTEAECDINRRTNNALDETIKQIKSNVNFT